MASHFARAFFAGLPNSFGSANFAGQMEKKPRKPVDVYKTKDFIRDIGIFLGDVRMASPLWKFIRRQITQELLEVHEVYIEGVGTFFFKFRHGRKGPCGWEDDRLILKFKPADRFSTQFHEAQKRGRGQRLMKELKKLPRRGDPNLKYSRVPVRQDNWQARWKKVAYPNRQPGSDSALAQPPIPSSSAGQEESTKDL